MFCYCMERLPVTQFVTHNKLNQIVLILGSLHRMDIRDLPLVHKCVAPQLEVQRMVGPEFYRHFVLVPVTSQIS